ncbi:MAG: radical SAM protein [Candidatus Peribacteria bacterium]|nr:radical SAM protein [Candidatus Peribacteria bacterium]
MLSSRGCSNKCSFCNVQSFRGKRQAKSPEAVVAEIQYLINTYHTEKILFLDDNATVDKERMKQIAKLLLHNNIKIKL